MYIKYGFREKILKLISLIPIKDKNLFRFKIRQIFICTLLYLYSFYPFSKFSRFFFYSLSDKFLNYEELYVLTQVHRIRTLKMGRDERSDIIWGKE